MNCKSLSIVLTLILAASITACSSSSHAVTPPPPPAISVAISTAPPATVTVNGTASLAATVSNDTAAAGVDWSCTPVDTCGSFSPTHTASAADTVFTASATTGAVVITAASTTTPAITTTVDVTVDQTTAVMQLDGTYTFFMNGWTENGAFSVVGSVVIDGNGNITGGEQDAFNQNTSTLFTADAIQPATGAVTVGDDGRGTITLTPTLAPAETLSIAVVNSKHVLITEFDDLATTTGAMDFQTAAASVPSNRNAFALFDPFDGFAYGGVFTSDGSSAIGTGESDANFEGQEVFDLPVTGFFTAPDAAGRGVINLSLPSFGKQNVAPKPTGDAPIKPNVQTMQFAYYVVGPEVFRLVEIDANFFATGSIYGQGSATYSYESLDNSFVFGLAGDEDFSFGVYSLAGQFTGDGGGGFSAGVADVNNADGFPVMAGDLTSSEYFVNPDGYAGFDIFSNSTDGLTTFGMYLVDPNINIADPNSSTGGGGALMIELDDDNVGTGIIVPQTAGATFAGNYAISQDGAFETESSFGIYDIVGQVNSDGVSAFSGTADVNDILNGLNPALDASATYAADGANPGRITAVVTFGEAAPANITLYQASDSLLLHVDTDSDGAALGIVGLGVLEQQQLPEQASAAKSK